MKLLKTVKLRIKDSGHISELNQMARAVNLVWNYCNETSIKAIRYDSKYLSGFDLGYLTAGTGKDLGLLATTVQEVGTQYANRRMKSKKKSLRWRGAKSLGWVPFRGEGIWFKNGTVHYKDKTFNVFQPERIPARGTYRSGEFCEDSRGRWYVCITVSYDQISPTGAEAIGIDLGIKSLATLSNGTTVENSAHYRKQEKRLSRFKLANKARQARSLNAKIKNKRCDDLHKASTRIANDYRIIVVGQLQAAKLAKTRMGKSINDAGTSMFRTMLKYKASARQHWYVEVNEANTTRTCSACGVIPDSSPRGLKGLSVREWACCECGSIHDRDVNAAINILRLGHQALSSEVAKESNPWRMSKMSEVDFKLEPLEALGKVKS